MARGSYKQLTSLPAYGLYEEVLVASIRANSAEEAKELFKKHNLKGDIVHKIKK